MSTLSSVNGILLVNKPSGPTSYDMIRYVKRNLGRLKIGHCGTLDPIASGLLILLFGSATKKQSEFMGLEKTYRYIMRLGIKTETADITGQVVETRPVAVLDHESIKGVLKSFMGPQLQIPPMHSALKLKGVPLYKLARKGTVVAREPRPIHIYNIEFLGQPSGQEIEFRVRCSAGTYVRTLVEDIAAKLNTIGTMASLCRESIGPFEISRALPGEHLQTLTPEMIFERIARVN